MMKKRAIVLAVSMLYIVSGTSAAAAEVNEEITESTAADTVEETAEAVDASEEIIEITSAEELAAINDNLSGNYVLTADIDLEGAEWTPLGSFVQQGEEGEEAEMPDLAYVRTESAENSLIVRRIGLKIFQSVLQFLLLEGLDGLNTLELNVVILVEHYPCLKYQDKDNHFFIWNPCQTSTHPEDGSGFTEEETP